MSNVVRLPGTDAEPAIDDVDPQDVLVELNHQQIAISDRLVASAETLRGRAVDQVAALDQMDGAVERLRSELAQMTTQAASAQSRAIRAVEAAQSGRESLSQSVKAMESMGATSRQIEHLAELLQAVAKQTSLLALNASIEAARVGEAGRGFAVIAGEIGSLSKTTKNAVDEVSSLVKRTETWIDDGVELSRTVEADLDEITGAATETVDEVSTIVVSAEGQVVVAAQTCRAVREVVQLVDENMVEVTEISEAGIQLQHATSTIMSMAAEYYDL